MRSPDLPWRAGDAARRRRRRSCPLVSSRGVFTSCASASRSEVPAEEALARAARAVSRQCHASRRGHWRRLVRTRPAQVPSPGRRTFAKAPLLSCHLPGAEPRPATPLPAADPLPLPASFRAGISSAPSVGLVCGCASRDVLRPRSPSAPSNRRVSSLRPPRAPCVTSHEAGHFACIFG